MKIGIAKQFFTDDLSNEVRNALNSALEWYKSQGAELVEVDLPSLDTLLRFVYV